MRSIILLLGLIVALCVCWYLANQFFEVATEKGFTDRKYFWICLLLGAVGWILVCALPDRGNRTTPAISDELPDL